MYNHNFEEKTLKRELNNNCFFFFFLWPHKFINGWLQGRGLITGDVLMDSVSILGTLKSVTLC